MVITVNEIAPGVFLLTSDRPTPDAADRDFIDWAEANGCYTPTASEMDEDENGRWYVKVMKEPAAE